MPASQRHLSTSQSRPASAKFKVKKRSAPSFTKPSFTLADVPALDFWQAHAKPPVLRAQISAEDLHSAVLRYADIALAGDQGWREQLLSTHGISAVTLHYAAALIILGPAGRPWFLATHILHSLVLLGYEPSILTMVRLAWRTRKLGEPQFQPAEDAFHRILSNAKSAPIGPDAATLAGLLASFAAIPQYTSDVAANPGWHHKETAQLIYHGNMGKALEWYRYAARVGGDEPDAWDWQITCAQGLAVCYEAMRQEDRASEIYEYLATTLDHPEGCFLHADGLMKRGGSDPKVVEELLLKAAAGGVGRAASALERTYRSEAARASSKDVSRHYNIRADEWGAIAAASPRAPASEHTLPDSHQQDDGPSQQL